MLAVGDERRVLRDCTHHIRISQPVEALRSLAAAGALGSRSSDSGVQEFTLTVCDEDDEAFGGVVSGTLISFCRSYSSVSATAPFAGADGEYPSNLHAT